MKILRTAIATLIIGLLALVSPMVGPALAGDPVIDAAKSQGLIGEKIDGYLGIVGDVDAAVQRKVDEINAKRRAVYSDLAQKEGQPLSVVARLTGEKLIADQPSGSYVYDDSGQWIIKP